MKLKLLLISLITLIATGCQEKVSEKTAKIEVTDIKSNKQQPYKVTTSSTEGDLKIVGDSVIIPNFKIEVNLSDMAVKTLQNNKESIVTSLFFYGDVDNESSLPEDIKKELGPNGLKLLAYDFEKTNVTQSNEFLITHLTFPKKLYNALSDKHINLNVNIFSGRKAFKDNILDMEFFDAKFSEIVSHDSFLNLNGRLLKEDKN